MGTNMKTLCKCGAKVHRPPCSKCNPKKSAGHYDHEWRLMSEAIRTARPLCEICFAEGRVSPSREVHHIVPITQAPKRRLDPTNLQALCHDCHDKQHGGKANKFRK